MATAVLVNGRTVCGCIGDCNDERHLRITAEFTVDDVMTMELRVKRPAGFEYTNNHNAIELAVFRHNIDTTVTLGRPGMVYYVCVPRAQTADLPPALFAAGALTTLPCGPRIQLLMQTCSTAPRAPHRPAASTTTAFPTTPCTAPRMRPNCRTPARPQLQS